MKKFITILAVVLTLVGCKDTKTLLPNVSGKAGEIIVVIEKEDWEGAPGTEIRDLLSCECPFLVQPEPLYALVNVAHGGFSDLFKVHRNIVFLNINSQVDSTCINLRHDVWAAPQCIVQINAKNSEDAVQVIKDNGKQIVNAIEQAERNRVIANSIRYEEGSIALQVKEVFGGSPHFPMGYKLRKITDDFAWIANDKQSCMQDILIYKYPVLDNNPFALESIIQHRNEALQTNVPGMFDGTYMTTSTYFPPYLEYTRYRGREFAETHGYWEVENDYMGGPFTSHTFYSTDGFDIIVAEAFVYAPKYDKRQYLRQVESILYSWEWNKEEE